MSGSGLVEAAVTPPTSAGRWWLVALPLSFLFALTAIVLEVVGGTNANSAVPAWGEFVPLAWPQWARVLWWLQVAAAAATFRAGARRVGIRTRRLGDIATVGPFIVFSIGIAFGSDWTTFH